MALVSHSSSASMTGEAAGQSTLLSRDDSATTEGDEDQQRKHKRVNEQISASIEQARLKRRGEALAAQKEGRERVRTARLVHKMVTLAPHHPLLASAIRGNVKGIHECFRRLGCGPPDRRPMLANSVDQDGRTPLFYAVWNNHIDAAQEILRHHGDPNITDNSQNSPLHFACIQGHRAALRLLIHNRADPTLVNDEHMLCWETVQSSAEDQRLIRDFLLQLEREVPQRRKEVRPELGDTNQKRFFSPCTRQLFEEPPSPLDPPTPLPLPDLSPDTTSTAHTR